MSGPADVLAAVQLLRDVRGVEGSFVISANGGILAADLPVFMDASVVGAAAPRIQRLRESLLPEGEIFESCQLRYQHFSLRLQVFSRGLLCLLLAEGVNKAALRMAANITTRKLENLLQLAGSTSTVARQSSVATAPDPAPATAPKPSSPVPAVSSPATPGKVPVPPASGAAPKYYRGARVG